MTSSLLLQVYLPIVILVVVARREAFDWVYPRVDHLFDLGLHSLLVGDSLGQIVIDLERYRNINDTLQINFNR